MEIRLKKALKFFKTKLGIDKIPVKVNVVPLIGDDGEIRYDFKIKSHVVNINSQVNQDRQVRALAHELTHLQQIITKRLDYNNRTWLGKSYIGTDYKLEPWESEARTSASELWVEFNRAMRDGLLEIHNQNNMVKLKDILNEGVKEQTAEDFVKQTIKGSEWENKIYAVGGYVRDQLRGVDAKDLDLVVDAPNGGIEFSKWFTKKIGNYKEEKNPVIYPKFGTSKFHLNGVTHNGISLDGFEIEAVMPRSEQYTVGSRKPEVQQTTLKGDAERRDINFNALYKNISTGEIMDFTGKGIEDLEKGLIRTPIDPDKTFQDDALRQLRLIRFYAKYGYDIPLYIIRSMKKNAHRLKDISSERIQDELNKMLITTRPAQALKLLKITGLLDYIIPEFKVAYKMGQNAHHSQSVWGHTLSVVSKTQPVLLQRLMSLCHDIGKTVTRSVTPTGVHFYGHEKAGADIAEEVMRRLKYPVEMIDAVKKGVAAHMRLKHGGDDAIKLSDKTLRKFKIEMGEHLEDILNVIHADNLAHSEASSMPNQINNVRKRLDDLNVTVSKPTLPINGNDLIQMGIKPGPIFSKILSVITDKWYGNPSLSRETALKLAKGIANDPNLKKKL